jgi:hypothetical protein
VVAAVAGAAAAAAPKLHVVVLVRGGSTSPISTTCFLRLRQKIVGGGTVTYCLKVFHGEPGPNAVVRDSGTMTFAFRAGTIRASVHIVQRFAADGAHARQSLTGTVTGGSGRYARATGGVEGGGTDVERPPGHVSSSRLRYVISS